MSRIFGSMALESSMQLQYVLEKHAAFDAIIQRSILMISISKE